MYGATLLASQLFHKKNSQKFDCHLAPKYIFVVADSKFLGETYQVANLRLEKYDCLVLLRHVGTRVPNSM